jgi:hypothetical protein
LDDRAVERVPDVWAIRGRPRRNLSSPGAGPGAYEESSMVSREDVIKELSAEDQRWIARCQMIAVFLFLALVAGLVLWPVLPNVNGPAEAARSVVTNDGAHRNAQVAPAEADRAEAP